MKLLRPFLQHLMSSKKACFEVRFFGGWAKINKPHNGKSPCGRSPLSYNALCCHSLLLKMMEQQTTVVVPAAASQLN